MFKKRNVVILPTNQKAFIYTSDDKSYMDNKPIYVHEPNGYHLYITSDEEIEEGDWCFEIHNGSSLAPKSTPRFIDDKGNIWWLRQMNMNCSANDPKAKKIIATTDKSLSQTSRVEIPRPSKQFINKFIKEYNKGNLITDIMVEYDLFWNNKRFKHQPFPDEFATEKDRVYDLKVNPKDNTITIKRIKTFWNRKEVEDLFRKYIDDNSQGMFTDEDEEWLNENL